MKRSFLLIAIMVLSIVIFAQARQTFIYQTVVRDNSCQAINNQSISVEISILEDGANGTVVYSEVHSSTTPAGKQPSYRIRAIRAF